MVEVMTRIAHNISERREVYGIVKREDYNYDRENKE